MYGTLYFTIHLMHMWDQSMKTDQTGLALTKIEEQYTFSEIIYFILL